MLRVFLDHVGRETKGARQLGETTWRALRDVSFDVALGSYGRYLQLLYGMPLGVGVFWVSGCRARCPAVTFVLLLFYFYFMFGEVVVGSGSYRAVQ